MIFTIIIVLILLLYHPPYIHTDNNNNNNNNNVGTGYSKIHIIAHSHCDPGWLNTFEGYYLSDVKLILDNVLRELSNNENRKFVWSEKIGRAHV